QNGAPYYQLSFKGKEVIKQSKLGLELVDVPSFLEGFQILTSETSTVNETWSPILGEQSKIQNNYHELLVTLIQKDQNNRFIRIRFRLFNDGLGFRYEFPKQADLSYFTIKEEKTEFN